MYNSVYPININYTKYNQYRKNGDKNQTSQNSNSEIEQNPHQNPNSPQSRAMAYAKGQVNISQVLADFKSTIIAINAPENVKDEVYLYLNLVEKEAQKETPSRNIILSNLKNASIISDTYIAKELKKPSSSVVQNWIETLFQQQINLKANPDEINPDFLLEFPQKAQARIDEAKKEEQKVKDTKIEEIPEPKTQEIEISAKPEIKISNSERISVDNVFELSETQAREISNLGFKKEKITPYTPQGEYDKKARELFIQAKKAPSTNQGDVDAINYLNEALGIMAGKSNINQNIRAAAHFERGAIFDDYDYVDLALRDFYEATKTDDFNLKAQAYYRSGQIYDEFNKFPPALDNYLSSVAYSGEAENSNAQSRVLSKIASLYAKQFDLENTQEYTDLALDTAHQTSDGSLIADTYSIGAQNYQYLGENERALDNYKNALETFSREYESYEQMAYNYEQASIVMEKLGNKAKAEKLQLKANQYYQKAQQFEASLAEAY